MVKLHERETQPIMSYTLPRKKNLTLNTVFSPISLSGVSFKEQLPWVAGSCVVGFILSLLMVYVYRYANWWLWEITNIDSGYLLQLLLNWTKLRVTRRRPLAYYITVSFTANPIFRWNWQGPKIRSAVKLTIHRWSPVRDLRCALAVYDVQLSTVWLIMNGHPLCLWSELQSVNSRFPVQCCFFSAHQSSMFRSGPVRFSNESSWGRSEPTQQHTIAAGRFWVNSLIVHRLVIVRTVFL